MTVPLSCIAGKVKQERSFGFSRILTGELSMIGTGHDPLLS